MITLFLIQPLGLPVTLAFEGQCHLKHCFVPAPTILGPEQDDIVNILRPGIKGLTWKTAIVKVYLDGIELPNVKQIKHEDYYGSFYVEPAYDLAPGIHYVYTIAHSEKPGWYDQSKESIYIYFTVEPPPPPPVKPIQVPLPIVEPLPLPETASDVTEPALPLPIEDGSQVEDDLQEAVESILPQPAEEESKEAVEEILISPPEILDKQVDIIESNQGQSAVAVEAGQIEGGVYVKEESLEDIAAAQPAKKEQPVDKLGLQGAAGLSDLGKILENEFVNKEMADKSKRNRIIGLSVLALIVVFSIIWLAADKHKFKDKTDRGKEGELPPPPQPPQERAKAGRPSYNASLDDSKSTEVSPPPIEPAKQTLEAKPDSGRYFASPPPSPHSLYPPKSDEAMRSDEIKYVPLDTDNQLDTENALKDLEERFIPGEGEDHGRLL